MLDDAEAILRELGGHDLLADLFASRAEVRWHLGDTDGAVEARAVARDLVVDHKAGEQPLIECV